MGTLTVDVLRRVTRALEARLEIDLRWRGGEIDRLVDEVHARLSAKIAATLAELGWAVFPEVTFMRAGERGSIDLVGVKPSEMAAVIVEVKSELTSYEQTQRRLDAKARVAASVIQERFGWRPKHVLVVLALANTSSNRERPARVVRCCVHRFRHGALRSNDGFEGRPETSVEFGLSEKISHRLLVQTRRLASRSDRG